MSSVSTSTTTLRSRAARVAKRTASSSPPATHKGSRDLHNDCQNKGPSDAEKFEKWYPRWRVWHTYGASVISVLVAVGSSIGKISGSAITQNTEMVLLIVCVGVLGIPHGASDHVVIANTMYTYFRSFWLPAFLVIYLGLVGLVLFFWHLAPAPALFTFIAVSAIHFGLGDVDKALSGPFYLLEVPVRGFMIMVLPCVHHTHNVDRIWTWLVGDEEQNRSVQEALEWMHLLMPVWYVAACGILLWHQYEFMRGLGAPRHAKLLLNAEQEHRRQQALVKAAQESESSTGPDTTTTDDQKSENLASVETMKKGPGQQEQTKHALRFDWTVNDWTGLVAQHHSVVMELFSIYALFASTTPLVAFIVYFCIWHSARHNFMVAATCFDRSDAKRALVNFFWASVPFSLGALAMGYAGFVYMHDEPEHLMKVQLRMVFIGLNALTIPHMLFIELSDLRGRVAEGRCANFIGLVMGTNVDEQQLGEDKGKPVKGNVGKEKKLKEKSSPRLP